MQQTQTQTDNHRQNPLLKQYLNKYFSPAKIEQLVGELFQSYAGYLARWIQKK